MKRALLNIFSELFTGMQIKSASFDHWKLDLGGGDILSNQNKANGGKKEEISLADVDGAGKTK